jgi:hypothetical protein
MTFVAHRLSGCAPLKKLRRSHTQHQKENPKVRSEFIAARIGPQLKGIVTDERVEKS